MHKVIDGMLGILKELIIKSVTILGMYAAYELVFRMDIPVMISAFVIMVVTGAAWQLSAEEPRQQAIPVTVIENAEPIIPQVGDN